eukprot:m.840590 g.840590  ORF g.840590 m.840590 type:complete len:1577 (-) comp59514_c0_seq6:55-4785(-)
MAEVVSKLLELQPKESGGDPDLALPFITYITKTFEEPGENYTKEIHELTKLRESILTVSTDEAQIAQLRRYANQVLLLVPRISFAGSTGLPLPRFSWLQTFSGKQVVGSTLEFERNNVLYNLAVAEARAGNQYWDDARTKSFDLLQNATKKFQLAAVIFSKLAELSSDDVNSDLSPVALRVLRSLMVAQGHECVLAKAVRESKKAATIAGVAVFISSCYDVCVTGLASLPIAATKNHPWASFSPFIRAKAIYYRAFAHFYMSQACLQQQQFGLQVSRLRASQELVADLQGALKQTKLLVAEDLMPFAQLIKTSLAKAEQDNSFVYNEKVVPVGSLGEIPAVEVVKVPAFELDMSTPDIFSKLVPMAAHFSASEYSERKAEFLRRVNANIDAKNLELQQTLSALSLAEGYIGERHIELDAALFQKAATLRHPSEGLSSMDSLLAALSQARAVTSERLQACRDKLLVASGLSSLDRVSGKLQSVAQDFQELDKSFQAATAFDSQLEAVWPGVFRSLSVLTGPVDSIRGALKPPNAVDAETTAEYARLKQLLEKVQQLKQIREKLISGLRQQLDSDDILKQLVASTNAKQAMEDAFQKHNAALDDINSNFESQRKLMAAIIDANAKFASVRTQQQSSNDHQTATIEGLYRAFDTFLDLKKKADSGLSFYKQLGTQINELFVLIDTRAPKPTDQPVSASFPTFNFAAQPSAESAETSDPEDEGPGTLSFVSSRATLPQATTDDSTTDFEFVTVNHGDQSQTVVAQSFYLDSTAPASSELVDPFAKLLPPNGPTEVPAEEEPVTDEFEFYNPFEAYVKSLDEQLERLNHRNHHGKSGFEQEFMLLSLEDAASSDPNLFTAARANGAKNRYNDILPFDSTRVRLKILSTNPNDDYINASLIKPLCTGAPSFICSQGPTANTLGDFWKLVVQNSCRLIVMVTNCIELGRLKCDQYWPQSPGNVMAFEGSATGFAVRVTHLASRTQEAWIERDFEVEETYQSGPSKKMTVTQFHFTSWPDRDAPSSPLGFLAYLRAVMIAHAQLLRDLEAQQIANGPILVHCSAGVGRTGTFVGIFSALASFPLVQRGEASRPEVLTLVQHMRLSRRYMVQSLSQYIFCYQAIQYAAHEFLKHNPNHQVRRRVPIQQQLASSSGAAVTDIADRKQSKGIMRRLSESAASLGASIRRPRPPPKAGEPVPEASGLDTSMDASGVASPTLTPRRSDSQPQPESSGTDAVAASRQSPGTRPPAIDFSGSDPTVRSPTSRSPPASVGSDVALSLSGCAGNIYFINGVYQSLSGTTHCQQPVFKHTTGVPSELGALAGKDIFLYYLDVNQTWVVSMAVGSLEVIAYVHAPPTIVELTRNPWFALQGSTYELCSEISVKLIDVSQFGAQESSRFGSRRASTRTPSKDRISSPTPILEEDAFHPSRNPFATASPPSPAPQSPTINPFASPAAFPVQPFPSASVPTTPTLSQQQRLQMLQQQQQQQQKPQKAGERGARRGDQNPAQQPQPAATTNTAKATSASTQPALAPGEWRGRRGEVMSEQVLGERKNKDRHKAIVANHNRKQMADKKLRQSMGFMPPAP